MEQYEDLYENQLGHCAICLEHQCNLKKRLAIDHIHGTKKVRGLLCNDCNSGIGLLGESLGILESAKQYLLEKNR